ncbi:cbb3-type cytochrome oxidase assembly protein CcoS [Desulforhabdus amnigena]|jgi:cbb3-type cytochrome oxidase maturation protein|uniref:Cbb3-type cytochrome oxidase assembly protein CcoS n=1 Tax=Desulforhabdus amnigena TaxID=40218 RepID=A0A9W6FWF3_9BACT|nr:cbb3-type cytochrome oxidase assembly protein CcoS [Desulforhabdus amnigena]NLJ29882.1 cbb3-type cytochrome oxidase assembly protein CcoS [Deltaproteobacteria bacterium]GLI36245.1 hypothetical protein DAMNIGENAA_36780 [Desulforhabdus amnigena]
MAYYMGWILLVSVSVWTALIAFVWAVRAGQFSDQGRARFLPLIEQKDLPDLQEPVKIGRGAYALLFILALGGIGMLAVIGLSIIHMKG